MTSPRGTTAGSGLELPDLFSALPDFALGAVFLITWIRPGAFGGRSIGYLMLVMLLEFINVHSAAFMGNAILAPAARATKVGSIIGLGLFYTLFVGGFSLAFRRWWPLAAFWGLTLNRLTPVLFGRAPQGREKEFVQRGWAVGVMLYLLGAFTTTVLPLPRLGISSAVIQAQELPGSGLWIDQPWRVLAFGFLYFTGWGLSELYAHRWLPPTGAPEAESE